MNYHNKLCELVLTESTYFSSLLGFEIDVANSQTGYPIARSDIDVLVKGYSGEIACIEVKSNSAMRRHYEIDQLPRFRQAFLNAPVQPTFWLLEGTVRKSLNIDNLNMKQY